MGKVRKLRKKYHLSKVESAKASKEEAVQIEKSQDSPPKTVITPAESIFAGVEISYDSLLKYIPQDFDTKSVASTKSRKEIKEEEQHLPKKEKQRLRHERFMQKLDVMQHNIKDAKERKKRQKRPVIGDLNPLKDALPTLESLLKTKISKGTRDSSKKPKGTLKMKKRLKQQTKDAKLMRRILKDRKYKANPGQTIIDFLKQKVALER